jgi:dynactin 1
MSSLFTKDEAVYVDRDNGRLEGVLAYIGPVEFSAGTDWVGIRLTGSCAGKGMNNGSVKGKQYFECPENCGIFVREATVTKRNLTKLEELRLRRELHNTAATAAATATSTKAPATTPAIAPQPSVAEVSTPPRRQPTAISTSSTKPVVPSTDGAATAATSKLEELRKRRETLQAQREVKAATPKASASPGWSPKAAAAAASSDTLFEAKKVNVPPLQVPAPIVNDLANNDKEVKQLNDKVQTLQSELDRVKDILTTKEKELVSKENYVTLLQTKLAASEQAYKQARDVTYDNNDRLNELERSLQDWKEKAQDALAQLSTASQHAAREQAATADALDQLTAARTEARTLKQELAANENANQQRTSDATQHKERARMQTELRALQRRVKQLELDKQTCENNLEDVTLDKEQLLEEKEALEDRLEELRLDCESAQMEVEELKLELDDARRTTTSEGSDDAVAPDDADMAQALSVQNVRLREALMRLREQSSVEKMELARQLRDADKEAEIGRTLVAEVEQLRALKVELEEQINDLKDMVEQGAAFEQMVEDLSDRLFNLEEENIAFQTTIREMEESAELTAEMEEVMAEEVRALTRDLEGRDTIIRNIEEAIKM